MSLLFTGKFPEFEVFYLNFRSDLSLDNGHCATPTVIISDRVKYCLEISFILVNKVIILLQLCILDLGQIVTV